MTRLALIVALARNGTIGRDGTLPWHLPDDLRRFKALTLGKPIIMGRRTFESIGRPLPGRHNIVVTRSGELAGAAVTVARDLDAALAAARERSGDGTRAAGPGELPEEIMIIGGAQLYREALPRAQRIYLTRVEADVDGDVHFPPLEPREWRCIASEARAADERHAWALRYETLERVGNYDG